jgi:putative peptidoglycan lipid II flippase
LLPRGALLLSVLTFGSYAMGLVRDRTFARTFGAGSDLDTYNAALVLPELTLDILVIAGLSAAFIPVFAAARQRDPARAERFSRTVLTTSILIMALATGVLFVLAPATMSFVAPGFGAERQAQYTELFRLMCVTSLIFAASFALGEMLVARQRFWSYGLAPLLYNAGIAGGALFLGPRLGIYGAAVGTVIGALLHLAVRVVEARIVGIRFGFSLSVAQAEFREFVRLALPKMISQPVEPLTFLFFVATASHLVAGSVSSVSFARNFQSVPVSLIGVAFSVAAFPILSAVAASGDRARFLRLALTNLATITFITALGAVFVAVVSTFVVDFFLAGEAFDAEDVQRTGLVLAAFSLSIPLESATHLLARAVYATHNTILPVAASVAGLLVTVGVVQLLLPAQGIVALPLGFAAGQGAKVVLLLVAFFMRVRTIRPPAGPTAGTPVEPRSPTGSVAEALAPPG